jgi:hypothetical protein
MLPDLNSFLGVEPDKDEDIGLPAYTGDPNDYVSREAARYNVDMGLANALITNESGGRDNAVSVKGARGKMQVMPGTAKEMANELGEPFDPSKLNDPDTNVKYGMRYLAKMLDRYGGDPRFALVAYNAGPSGADQVWEQYQQTGVFKVPKTKRFHDGVGYTADYVDRIMAASKAGTQKVKLSSGMSATLPPLEEFLGAGGKETSQTMVDGEPIPPLEELMGGGVTAEQTEESLPADVSSIETPAEKKPGGWWQTIKSAAKATDAAAAAATNTLADIFSFGLTGLIPIPDREKQMREDAPIASTVGEVAGTLVGTVGMGGAAAKQLAGRITSPLARNLIARGGVAGLVTAASSVDDLREGRKTVKETILDVAQNSAGGAVSIVPEVIAPAGVTQLLAQPLTDLIFDAATDKLRGFDVGSKEWWKREAVNLALSLGFAVRDVKNGAEFKAEQAAQREELGSWLNGREVEIRPVGALAEELMKPTIPIKEQAQSDTPAEFSPIKKGGIEVNVARRNPPTETQMQAIREAEARGELPAPKPEEIAGGLTDPSKNDILQDQEGTNVRQSEQEPQPDVRLTDEGYPAAWDDIDEPSAAAGKQAFDDLATDGEWGKSTEGDDWFTTETPDQANARQNAPYIPHDTRLENHTRIAAEQYKFDTYHLVKKQIAEIFPSTRKNKLSDEAAEQIAILRGEKSGELDPRVDAIFGKIASSYNTDSETRKSIEDISTALEIDVENLHPDDVKRWFENAITNPTELSKLRGQAKASLKENDEGLTDMGKEASSGTAQAASYEQRDIFEGTNYRPPTAEEAAKAANRAAIKAGQEATKGGAAETTDLPMFSTQKDLFDAPSGAASAGRFARGQMGDDIPPEGLQRNAFRTEKEETISRTARIEMPELVETIRELGADASIKKSLRAGKGNAEGVFRAMPGNTPAMDFRADIFLGPKLEDFPAPPKPEDKEFMIDLLKQQAIESGVKEENIVVIEDRDRVRMYERDPDYSAKVAGHELFHFVDYLSESHPETLKRGNILGHVAGLYKYYKGFINSQQIYNNKQMRNELFELSRQWKPFDPEKNKKYTTYRKRPAELFADAGSVLVNNPDLLKQKAPSFYRAFFDFLNNRPQVKAIYEDIQSRIGTPELLEARQRNIREMAERARGVGVDRPKDLTGKDLYVRARKQYDDPNYAVKNILKEAQKRGITVSDPDNPYWAKKSADFTEGEQQAYLRPVERELQELQKFDLGIEDMHELMFEERVIHERSNIANPLGFQPKTAQRQLDALKEKLGASRFAALQKTVENIRKNRKEAIVAKLKEADMLSPELMKYIDENPYYATYAVAKSQWGKFGNEMTSKIFGQTGTLRDVKNVFTATTMKDLSLIRAANMKIAKSKLMKFMTSNMREGTDFYKAKTTYDARSKTNMPDLESSPGKDWGLVAYLDKGKVQGYWVPKDISDAYNKEPVESDLALGLMGKMNSFFRNIFTTWAPGFSIGFNPIRDYRRAEKNLPGMVAPFVHWKKLFPKWVDGLKAGHDRFFNLDNQTIKEMERGRMLMSTTSMRGLTRDDIEAERYLAERVAKGDVGPKVLRPLRKLLSGLEYLMTVTETSSKVAGYLYMKENTNWSPEKIAEYVRENVGTPNFRTTGTKQRGINALTLFLNSFKSGWKSNLYVAKERPVEFAFKTVRNISPTKVFMALAGAGVLGEYLQKAQENVSEYDRHNYDVLPLGMTSDDKTVYLRLPLDESDRFYGGIMSRMLEDGKDGIDADMLMSFFDYTAGQLPGLSPALELIADAKELLSGNNPKDRFRNRDAIPQEIWDTGDNTEIAKAALKYVWNAYGAKQLFKFDSDRLKKDKGLLEKALGLPIASDIFGRFIKVSDYGKVEKMRGDMESVAEDEARDRLSLKRKVRDYMKDLKEPPTMEEYRSFLMAERDEAKARGERANLRSIKTQWKNAVIQRFADTEIEELYRAPSAKQRQAIVDRVLDRKKLAGNAREFERKKLLRRARLYRTMMEE